SSTACGHPRSVERTWQCSSAGSTAGSAASMKADRLSLLATALLSVQGVAAGGPGPTHHYAGGYGCSAKRRRKREKLRRLMAGVHERSLVRARGSAAPVKNLRRRSTGLARRRSIAWAVKW